jgi:multiple sugar transport system ATP-binding protein
MARVSFENVVKQFGDVIAVNNLNIDVADKEFLVLVGPSGCGKTTALRCWRASRKLPATDQDR